ncbi:hypothetical protein DFP74_0155 [Nocardiopsis sp. Huas11]|uniref:hypothetical protein n=1 Tax=Nocardiopsis sp. Huas11 TaxID=2183912 RepID=UPI000EB54794|nr:hypothetical protein [Nocardiopsis sp. Huas11]RKS04595.1 hypothetical protein DFP74_0155 [Nocardiopsis sp. Huas11]
MTDDRIDEVVGRLRPEVEASSRLDPAAPAARELRSMIIAQSQENTQMSLKPRTRRLLIAAPVTAAVAVGAVAATVLLTPAGPDGDGSPLAPPAAQAAVLEMSVTDGVVVAEVLDPTADAERYAAEFAEHGLNVDMRFVPASPTAVGTLVYLDSDASGEAAEEREIEILEAPEQCAPGGGGACPVGVSIPEGYAAPVEIVFGREAEPGEPYDSSNAATAEGEALEGLDAAGMTMGELRAALAERDQEIAEYRQDVPAQAGDDQPVAQPSAADAPPELDPASGGGETIELAEDEVGDDWLVEDVSLWAPGEVLVFVTEPV